MVISVANVFAGNTPPIITLDGMLEFAKFAFKLPETVRSLVNVAASATVRVFPSATAPPTFMVRLNDASPSTNSLSFVVMSSYTNNR